MAATIASESRIQETRRERIEARLTVDQKALVARAAALEGVSISSFLVQRALDSAARTVEQHELVRLSAKDSQRIAEALLGPPEPTSALTDAVRRYRKLVSG